MIVCLNPCFSGNRFGRKRMVSIFGRPLVLILVLVEIGLGDLDDLCVD